MGEGLKRARAAAKASRKPYTLGDAMEAVARKDPQAKLPHGVIGMFAKGQFEEVANKIKTLPE